MGQNSNSFKIYLKRKIKAFWMPLLMVFTFFVPALFASDQFPMQTHSQPLEGTLSSDEILIRMKTIKNITAHDALGNSIQIPQNTTVETSTSFLQMLDQYSLNKNQSQDDIFFNDILQQFQILKYFESIESTKSTAESSDSSEKKSTKQKVKIVESLNKELKKKKDSIVEIDVEDLDKFEVTQQDGAPISIDSDFDGDPNWNPNAEETIKDPKTEAQVSKYCKTCQANKKFDLKDLAQDLSFKTKASTVNSLFADLKTPEDQKVKKQIDIAINVAIKNIQPKSTGWCYRYTKDALVAAGMTKPRLAGRYSKQAGAELEKQGFVNLLDPVQVGQTRLKGQPMNELLSNPYLAPKGAILVYAPNPSDRLVRVCETKNKKKCFWDQDAGHVEIKTDIAGKGGVVSDYYNEKPRTGGSLQTADRKLVGIYYKL